MYNYALAKCLDKLKPLSVNKYTISNVFEFVEEIQHRQVADNDTLVSYDTTALFTIVPLEETIQILSKKASDGNWFTDTHTLSITNADLNELLRVATKDQLFQFDSILNEQVDGVIMGLPLGPLMANKFMCPTEEKLEREIKLPLFYRGYVDDTFALIRDSLAATYFLILTTLNEAYPSINQLQQMTDNPSSELKSSRRITIWKPAYTERRLKQRYFHITRATSISDTNDHSR